MRKPPRREGDAGFTLIELAVAMVLFGIVVAFAVGPFMRYNRAQQHIGITRRVVAALRAAQVSAVSENSVYRADFTSSSVRIFRKDPATSIWSQTSIASENESAIAIVPGSFTLPDGTGTTSCYFFPRGIASATAAGGITVTRAGSAKVYTIKVEGLTARVSYQ